MSPAARPTRRVIFAGVVVLVLLGIAAVVWIAVTGLTARRDANAVRSELATLKSELTHGHNAAAAQLEARMQAQAADAHSHTTGPAWWFASHIPYLGAPAKTVRGGTAIVDDLAHDALPSALTAGRLLNPDKLRSGHDQIDPHRLSAAAQPLGRAVTATNAVVADADALPSSTWLGKVDSSRTLLVQELTKLQSGLTNLSTASQLLPAALGENGTRRYFVAFQTEAEARGLGGLPGSYAILQARHGKLHFLRFGSDRDLGTAQAHLNLGADYNREYGQTFTPLTTFVNSNPSPHFPYAARTWMSMWEDTFHQHLDGAIATDPESLSYLLGAIGPVTLADGTVINESNAVSFFESGVYARFHADSTARKIYQQNAARKVVTSVLHEPSDKLLASATALQRASDERRLLVYTSDPTIEGTLDHESLGGILPATTDPFLDVTVNDAGGDKIGYYLDRSVTYRRTSCAASTATVTVKLHNAAPTSGLPGIVIGFELGYRKLWGSVETMVSLYGTDNSSVSRLTLDGKPMFFSAQRERGHPVAVTDLLVKPGQTRTLVYRVHEPTATAPMIALQQPGSRPLTQTIAAPRCGA
jgi:hypothetical protein